MPPTTPKALGRATPKKAKPRGLDSIRITISGVGSHVLRDDWTARVAERCRRELGGPPETVVEELLSPMAKASKADRMSIDTIVRAYVVAAWQAGDVDVSYDALLDTVRMSTDVELEPNPKDDSPEV